jgi:hypothetical protein
VLECAECIVLAQKPSPEAASQIAAAGRPVIDLVRCGQPA